MSETDMIYDSKAISEDEFSWITVRFRLLFDEGWEPVPHPRTGEPYISAGVVYLRRPHV